MLWERLKVGAVLLWKIVSRLFLILLGLIMIFFPAAALIAAARFLWEAAESAWPGLFQLWEGFFAFYFLAVPGALLGVILYLALMFPLFDEVFSDLLYEIRETRNKFGVRSNRKGFDKLLIGMLQRSWDDEER